MMLSFYFRRREDDGMSGALPTRISEGTFVLYLAYDNDKDKDKDNDKYKDKDKN